MIELQIWGGAGESGRSCYFIRKGNTRILLDCGVKKEGNGEYPLLDAEEVKQLDAVFVSHAHEDHAIALPLLYQQGYRGKVYTAKPTMEQLPMYVRSWHSYVSARHADLPYSTEDQEQVRFEPIENLGEALSWIELSPFLQFCWGRSGHMPGAMWFLIRIEGNVVFYSGDYTAESEILMHDLPQVTQQLTFPGIDLALLDAAYGAEEYTQQYWKETLIASMERLRYSEGTTLLPLPLYGRSQELLIILKEAFPEVQLVVEQSIMSAFKEYARWGNWLRPGVVQQMNCLLEHRKLFVVSSEADRQRVRYMRGSKIIVTTDGMMQSRQVQKYFHDLKNNPNAQVVLSGHLAAESFAFEVLQNKHELQCRVDFIRYKVHQGLQDVRHMLDLLKPKYVIPLHASKETVDPLVARLSKEGYTGFKFMQAGERLLVKTGKVDAQM